jgi:ubiquinone/menaquinone biosynthesis C-methylase UbiE
MDPETYHLEELRIATDTADPRRIMPGIPAGCRSVLDIGCGAGQTLIASRLPADVRMVGVDIDPGALRLGRQLESRIGFACSRGESLPLRADSFDFVFCRVALPYMHVQRAVREMYRVLSPGGSLWLALHPLSLTLRELTRSVAHFNAGGIAHVLYVLGNGAMLHLAGREMALPFRPGRYESFQTQRSISRALRAAGFTAVHFDRNRGFLVTACKA